MFIKLLHTRSDGLQEDEHDSDQIYTLSGLFF